MSDGRSKETQRGLGTPEILDASALARRDDARHIRTDHDARTQRDVRTEPTVGRLRVIAPASGTPTVRAASISAHPPGTPAAAAYAPPKTPPPVRGERQDTIAVRLSDEIDPQKVPTEPSLSRRREPSAWSDIELLPKVKYRNGSGIWNWVLVAVFGGVVGYWVYWGAAQGGSAPRTSVSSHGAASANPVASPTLRDGALGTAKAEPTILVSGSVPAPLVASAPASEGPVSNEKALAVDVSAQPPGASVEKKAPLPSKAGAQAVGPAPTKPAAAQPAPKHGAEPWLQ